MNVLLESALVTAIVASTIRGTTPILLAALGEAYAERSGLLNLGIEGMMVAGAFSSFTVALKMNSLLSGFMCAAVVGLTLGIVFGILTINLGVNQIVVGLGLTIFANSMCSFLRYYCIMLHFLYTLRPKCNQNRLYKLHLQLSTQNLFPHHTFQKDHQPQHTHLYCNQHAYDIV